MSTIESATAPFVAFVSNLPSGTTPSELKMAFMPYVPTHSQLLTKTGGTQVSGLVEFKTKSELSEVIQKNVAVKGSKLTIAVATATQKVSLAKSKVKESSMGSAVRSSKAHRPQMQLKKMTDVRSYPVRDGEQSKVSMSAPSVVVFRSPQPTTPGQGKGVSTTPSSQFPPPPSPDLLHAVTSLPMASPEEVRDLSADIDNPENMVAFVVSDPQDGKTKFRWANMSPQIPVSPFDPPTAVEKAASVERQELVDNGAADTASTFNQEPAAPLGFKGSPVPPPVATFPTIGAKGFTHQPYGSRNKWPKEVRQPGPYVGTPDHKQLQQHIAAGAFKSGDLWDNEPSEPLPFGAPAGPNVVPSMHHHHEEPHKMEVPKTPQGWNAPVPDAEEEFEDAPPGTPAEDILDRIQPDYFVFPRGKLMNDMQLGYIRYTEINKNNVARMNNFGNSGDAPIEVFALYIYMFPSPLYESKQDYLQGLFNELVGPGVVSVDAVLPVYRKSDRSLSKMEFNATVSTAINIHVAIEKLHHRVFFDWNGFWYAADDSRKQKLMEFAKREKTKQNAEQNGIPHLPLICELAKNQICVKRAFFTHTQRMFIFGSQHGMWK